MSLCGRALMCRAVACRAGCVAVAVCALSDCFRMRLLKVLYVDKVTKKTEISASRIRKNSVTPYCLSFGAWCVLLLRAVTGLALSLPAARRAQQCYAHGAKICKNIVGGRKDITEKTTIFTDIRCAIPLRGLQAAGARRGPESRPGMPWRNGLNDAVFCIYMQFEK